MQKSFSLNCLENFEVDLPEERIKAEVVTTEQILEWSDAAQKKLRAELEYLISVAFPKMPKKDQLEFVEKFFRKLRGNFHRHAMLLRNEKSELIAVSSFDCGEIEYDKRIVKTIYYVLRAILKKYQSSGLGQLMGTKVLMGLQPDIMLLTSYQSAALHAWVRLNEKGLITGFEVYPRLEQTEGKDVLITVPLQDRDMVIHIFKTMFPGVVNYDQERINHVLRNLTVFMIRKNDHGDAYDFNPWEKNERKDKLAEALGVTDKDGVLVVFKKI